MLPLRMPGECLRLEYTADAGGKAQSLWQRSRRRAGMGHVLLACTDPAVSPVLLGTPFTWGLKQPNMVAQLVSDLCM